MRNPFLFVVLTAALSGCATLDRATGPQLDAGSQLAAINETVGRSVGHGALCGAHTEAAAQAVAALPGYDSTPVYSCPAHARTKGICHVSLLVSSPDGKRWVLDNGAVIGDAVGVAHVASFDDYAERVEQVYWIGLSPDWDQILAKYPDFPRQGGATFASLP